MSVVLQTTPFRVRDNPEDLLDLSLAEKWGDGLPLIPPTSDRIATMLAATPRPSTDVVAELPPKNGSATIELIAINAVMAGCEPKHLPLLIAALEAAANPAYHAVGLVATTSSAVSTMIVNGPLRDEMGINYRGGCLGGAASRGSATLGRAFQLCWRNIGGMRVGESSRSVFGQPGRLGGVCFGEWEERSDWPSLAERRGFSRDQEVVTLHAATGTVALLDSSSPDVRDLAYLIGKSIAAPMTNLYVPVRWRGETVVLINPIWAERLAQAFPRVESFQEFVFENSWQPIELWPEFHQKALRDCDRVDSKGRVHVMVAPDRVQPVICGGLGNLHGMLLPSWGESEMQSSVTQRVAGA